MSDPQPALAVAPTNPPRRLVYLGTPDMAVPPLRALVAAGFDVGLVITRIDKRRGRGSATSPSPVKAAALELGLPVSHDLADATEIGADLGVVVAYGRIIPVDVLAKLAMVNIHFSLLPRWRGAAPVERALLAGDETTGVCLMEVAEGLDTGAVFARRELTIGDDDLGTLRHRLVEAGTDLLVEELTAGLQPPVPQEGEPTHAAKIGSDEFELDPSRSADELQRLTRLGRAWTTFRGKRLKVLEAVVARGEAAAAVDTAEPGSLDGPLLTTGDGVLELVVVQPEGKRAMAAGDWVNGAQPRPGERLG
ncbi:MAG: methionyl-tRNA formyltransferase [Actinomycetota bacterium]